MNSRKPYPGNDPGLPIYFLPRSFMYKFHKAFYCRMRPLPSPPPLHFVTYKPPDVNAWAIRELWTLYTLKSSRNLAQTADLIGAKFVMPEWSITSFDIHLDSLEYLSE